MNLPDYFIPDQDAPAFYPLRDLFSTHAPPLGVAAKYIDALTAPGDLIIDPFGMSPNVARAALNLGRRALVVQANPLWAWLTRAMATVPPESEINAALTRLGDAIKDDVPLRAHISQLYATVCAACGKPTPADYFMRARGGEILQRHYTCEHCGATRDDPADDEDRERAATFDAHGLHYHLAHERVAPEDGSHAARIHKLLEVYTPRNLYALVTLTQKIDSLFRAPRERDILLLLLSHLLERGTSFFAAPDAAAQLTPHKQFVEFNLWREIERAARALTQVQPIPLAESIDEVINSTEPRAFIGRGRAKTLASAIPRHSAALVLTAPPTRRAAVWALSYFWGAWILGRAAVQPLAAFLDSTKDAKWEWRWYADTLNDSLIAIAHLLRADARAAFVFNEAWQRVIENLLIAAATAHLNLESFLFQPRVGDYPRREFDDIRGDYRITFASNLFPSFSPTGEGIEQKIRATALAAASDILARRGEALAYSWVHHAAWTRLAREGLIDQVSALKMKTPTGRFIHNAVVAGLNEGYAHDFDHYQTPTQFVWLRRSKALSVPLIDRVDEMIRNQVSPVEIYRQFPNDLTPEAGLIELCVQANAEQPNDEPARALELLTQLGTRLGYKVAKGKGQRAYSQDELATSHTPYAPNEFDLVWQSNGETAHGFVWRARADFADLAQIHIAPARGYVLVPEARVAWLGEKLRRVPHLADAFNEAGWHFVRMPFVEKLLAQEKIERHDLMFITGLVPPRLDQNTQLGMFDDM